MFPILLAPNLLCSHDVSTAQIRLSAFLFSLPFANLRMKRGDPSFLRIAHGTQGTVVQQRQNLTLLNSIANLGGDVHDATVALSSDIGLPFRDKRSGSTEVP
jgi:hypothetical protein